MALNLIFEFNAIKLSTACQQDVLPKNLGRELTLSKFLNSAEHLQVG